MLYTPPTLANWVTVSSLLFRWKLFIFFYFNLLFLFPRWKLLGEGASLYAPSS